MSIDLFDGASADAREIHVLKSLLASERDSDSLDTRGDAMSAITIDLSEDRLAKLREIAKRYNVAPEDLARVSIEELLTRPEEAFQRAADHILDKNAELYRRLS